MHWIVPALFLCSAPFSQAATNWVSGTAYGTDYSALATAGSIDSVASADGSLIIGYESTTNLNLSHDISGFVMITNQAAGFKMDAAGATLTSAQGAVFTAINSTNLVINGGKFVGVAGTAGNPPIPMQAVGGGITESTVTISGSEFSGINGTAGFVAERSDLTLTNDVTVRGGDYGIGLIAADHSTATIHSGSFTGGVGTTAFWLKDSDATVYDGTFAGNIDGDILVAGTGLFSELTGATTNHVALHGGTFSSLAFYSTNGAVQHFLAGTNLVVENGIIQNGGTVVVDNQANTALQQIILQDGTMQFGRDFTLGSNGVFTLLNGTMSFPSNTFNLADGGRFILDGQDSAANFNILNIAPNATMNIGVASVMANDFYADSFSTNMLAITDSTNGLISTQTAWFDTNSVLVVNAAAAGMSSIETNDYGLISANTNQLFAGASTNSAATADDLKDNVTVETTTSDRTRFIDLFFDTVDGKTIVKFQFTAMPLKEYWDLTNGTSAVVTEEFADELDQLAGRDMLALIDGINDPSLSLTATEQAYFTTYNTFQTVLNGIQAAVGQSASRGAEYREQLNLRPSGARGPHPKNDLRGWAKYYGQRYSHDAVELIPEYETSLDGGVIGVDKSLGGLLVGLAGGYGRYSTTSGSDGEENITAYHGALYGTLGLDTAYIDAGVGYGFNQVENRTSSPFVLNGEFDAQILSAYLGGGIDLVDATEGMVFTPEASIQYSMYEQDAYTETSDVAVPRAIDAFDADSLRGSVGLNVSVQDSMKMETFSFKYDVRFHWIREFNPDPGNMDFSLEGGSDGYQLAYPMLDEDVYRAGIGVAFFNTLRNQPKNVLFRLDFDELFGDGFNSHNLSAKVIYAF